MSKGKVSLATSPGLLSTIAWSRSMGRSLTPKVFEKFLGFPDTLALPERSECEEAQQSRSGVLSEQTIDIYYFAYKGLSCFEVTNLYWLAIFC